MAEYFTVPNTAIVDGNGLGFDDLALVEPLAIGVHGVRKAAVVTGDIVLVIGAGPIGLATMKFAELAGGRVIAIDVYDQRLKFCSQTLNHATTVNALAPDVMEQLRAITDGDLPTVVMDATGNLQAINKAFNYMAHGGRYVLIGLQIGDISFSHPEFHKKEVTLMRSRNATKMDFEYVISCLHTGTIDPSVYITHRSSFDKVVDEFASWLDPSTG